MWQKYFKVINIVPGPVIFPKYGRIDFANPSLSLDLITELYENDCQFLKITPLGLKEIYGITKSTDPVEVPSTEPTEAPSTDPVEAPSTDPVEAPSTEPTEAPGTEPTEAPLTIITRTSFRPIEFRKATNSILNQTYTNIHHLVLCDNDQAVQYVEEYYKRKKNKNYSIHKVQKQNNEEGFYNLYLNEGIKLTNQDSYILILDDDNYLINKNCITQFFEKTNPFHGFYITQFRRKTSNIKPNPELFKEINYYKGNTKPIIKGKIDSSCAIFKKHHAINAKWDDKLAADYRFIKQLATDNDYTFIPHIIVQSTPTGNKGK